MDVSKLDKIEVIKDGLQEMVYQSLTTSLTPLVGYFLRGVQIMEWFVGVGCSRFQSATFETECGKGRPPVQLLRLQFS